MRKVAGIGLAILATLVLQSTVLPLLPLGPAPPDLMVVVCVYLGLHIHSPAGAVAAFVIGYVQDSLSGTILGVNAFAMSMVFAAVYLTSRHLWVDNVVSKLAVVFLASLAKTVVVVAVIGAFLSSEGLWHTVLRYAVVQALLTALLGPPILGLLHRALPEA